MKFAHAKPNDIPTLTSLLNRSYRGESSRAGWTTEADLLSGKRIDEAGVSALLNNPDSYFFIAFQEETIVASIHAYRENNAVHFGLFAVEPTMQGSGIGKQLLAYAETESMKRWKVDTAVMEVITLRSELIEYYERRGYVRTGATIPFPESGLWEKRVDFLEFSVMEKKLA
ncbi:MAG: GNAT family N-acetyltransferase [Sulfuricurvum sp.]|uniref:GNAT family N-acetyltransferase n=2 Tax=Sulfuricurvum sp. TaxID=2025608 RepID=UPI00262D2247|nr:GNAT family N-acetyltransferase [uncultured Sulfuricurvum sp.]